MLKVSGDCIYFDYKRMPVILESKTLSSVPIGLPISNCKIMLVGENAPNEGEIYVRGLCLGAGYFDYPSVVPLNSVELPEDACLGDTYDDHRLGCYFRTGDYARQLQSGDLVFLGRKDRSIKINGQRIALEEIECVFREHPDVSDAAVLCQRDNVEISQIEAHLVLKQKNKCNENFKSSLRRWMIYRLPQAMVPGLFFFTECLPISSSGKVDYNLLASSSCCKTRDKHSTKNTWDGDLLETIKKVFCDALIVENICTDDNFFELGGNSISAANAAYKLGINMKMLYSFPTPLKLQSALQRKIGSATGSQRIHANKSPDLGATNEPALHSDTRTGNFPESNPHKRMHRALSYSGDDNPVKVLKGDSSVYSPRDLKFNCFWNSDLLHTACSFTRCNKTMHSGKCGKKLLSQTIRCQTSAGKRSAGSMQEIWKVYMESCVDASPLIIFKESNAYLFIGSHSQKFVCIEAKSGFVLWEVKLEGRIECSATVVDNFSQVVVGCYQGNIYFLQFSDGRMCWKFKTGGEVKSQPVVDKQRNLVWCGSYDHNLYALDYKNYCCIYKLSCGGSIFGSPAFDELREKLFVASTSGRVTAISVKASAFAELWIKKLEVPIFGSLSISSSKGSIICCLVDSSVVSLAYDGSIIWRANTGGPIFAESCISDTLPSQVLVCSRDGRIYSFELEDGKLLWQYATGEPITSSAYVDESMELVANISSQPGCRLVCVCTSSGSIIVLCVSSLETASGGTRSQSGKIRVEELGRLNLEGDIFSSPVMIGGKIFVGCRDDYVHCIGCEHGMNVTNY